MESVIKKASEKLQKSLRKKGGGAKYFSGAKRGEAAELKADLDSADLGRQRAAVKRVIANMTMGRDVSYLFVPVVKLGQTTNLELKKLVYLYVLNTAKLQPDKALLAVNTFLQDANSPSPVVRALAIRTMMCIRVESVIEYTLEPLRRAIADPDPYVRKTAAVGLVKLFHYNMDMFYEQGFLEDLKTLLHDTYPVVASNAAAVVGEINDYGSMAVETKNDWVNRLLTHLPESNEWGQVYILDLLSSMRPKDAQSAEALVSRVMPRLSHTNPSVVMAGIKVIASLANRCLPDSVERFTTRINAALLTLSKEDPETQYVVCKNVHALLVIFPNLLRHNLDAFYVRFNDPPYVKLEKLHLLLKLVTPATAQGVVRELAEYSTEVDILFVEEVVRAVSFLAIKVEAAAPDCANLLMEMVDQRPELLPHVVTAAKNIARKYPGLLLLEPLVTEYGADGVVEEDAKVSLLWMLGEFGDSLEGRDAILAHFVDTILTQEQTVQLAILSAVIKMFLRDQQGMQPTVNQVLETIANRSTDPDVRDRAFAYWRLLSKGMGVGKLKTVVHGQIAPVNVDRTFSDAMTMLDLKKSLNTAAVVFGKPFQSFLPPYGLTEAELDEEEDEAEEPLTPNMGPQSPTTFGDAVPAASPPDDDLLAPSPTAASGARPSAVNDMDELFGTGPSPSSAPTTSAAGATARPSQPSFDDLFH